MRCLSYKICLTKNSPSRYEVLPGHRRQCPITDSLLLLLLLLFLWLFPSCRVAGIACDLSSPHRPVRLLARSQSSTFQISLTRVFPSCFRSSSLPFPWYIRPQHFPQYVFAISPHHMPVPVQSSLGDLFGSLCHSCCSSDVFIPDLVFACHSAHPS